MHVLPLFGCDDAYAIRQSSDGGFIVAGGSCSYNGDVSGNHGATDVWVLKLGSVSTAVQDLPELEASSLEIFPNPSRDNINLKANSTETILTVSITDAMGKLIHTRFVSNGGGIDLTSFPNGMYTVRATTPSGKMYPDKFRKQQ